MSVFKNQRKTIVLLFMILTFIFLIEYQWTFSWRKMHKGYKDIVVENQKMIYFNNSDQRIALIDNTLREQHFNTSDNFQYGSKLNPLDAEYINKVDQHILDPRNKLTIPFLPNYQNPCWFSNIPANISGMYEDDDNPLIYLSSSQGKAHWLHRLSPVRDEIIRNKETVQIKCLPHVYLIGVMKCGTTDLYHKLTQHPQIFQGTKKEYHWWNMLRYGRVLKGKFQVTTLNNYIESFDSAARNIRKSCPGVKSEDDHNPCVAIDGSIRLLSWHPPDSKSTYTKAKGEGNYKPPTEMTPALIYNIQPTAKLLVILREPIARCYSEYFYYNRNTTKDPKKFHQDAVVSLNTLKQCIVHNGLRNCVYNRTLHTIMKTRVHLHGSLYYIYLNDWLSVWPREQIHVITLEEFSANRTSVFNGVTDFLGLDPFPDRLSASLAEKPPSNYNPTSKEGQVWPETRTLLEDFFQPYNDKLAELLNDDKFRWKE